MEKINIDEITQKIDSLNDSLNLKIKEISVKIDSAPSNIKNKKSNSTLPLYYGEYDSKKLIYKNYLQFKNQLLELVYELVHKLNKNWFRRVKWLYNFILDNFSNFTIRNNFLHQSVAIEYKNMLMHLLRITKIYYQVFKDGLFPN